MIILKRFFIKRFISMFPVILLICIISFFVVQMLPGDAAMALLGEQQAKDEATYQALRQELGLDKPLSVRFITWFSNIVVGDFGVSARTGEPVANALLRSVVPTLCLIITSMLLAIIIGLPSGIISAVKPNGFWDSFTSIISTFGIALPTFWLGLILIYLFSLIWGLLPPSGYVSFWESPIEFIKLMILPTFALGVKYSAVIQRQTRAALRETLNKDYIRTAWSKGLSGKQVILKHALRNSIIPVLTIIGMQIGRLFGGAVTIEVIFRIPGMGRLAADSILFRDFRMVQGVMIVIGCAVMLTNFMTDILYTFFNPHIRYN